MSEYITISGDTWDIISYRMYGTERYIQALINANPTHRYTLRFSGGLTLAIPEIAPDPASNLPPWRRS